jgi:hypothetical protein
MNAAPVGETDVKDLRDAFARRATDAQSQILKHLAELGVQLLASAQFGERIAIKSRQGVNKRKGLSLLAVSFETRKGDYYPDFQLDGGTPQPWVASLLERIPDGWAVLAFLTAKRASLKGVSHLSRILRREDRAVEAMLADADDYLR